QRPFIVYRVFSSDNSDTYKFGITSAAMNVTGGEDGWVAGRPAVALAACNAHYVALGNTAGCVWNVVGEANSYGGARQIEYDFIMAYRALNNGYCPPGQAVSCK